MKPKSKNQLRREKLKLQKQQQPQQEKPTEQQPPLPTTTAKPSSLISSINLDDPALQQFQQVFARFQPLQEAETETELAAQDAKCEILDASDSEETTTKNNTTTTTTTVSKKQLRKQSKIPLAVLKASTPHPELVQWHDTDARDPLFLIQIKASRNTVPVPNHWQLKREYLSSRHDKKAFNLPPAIAATGIMEMRDTTNSANDEEAADSEKLKAKQRQKVRPKLNSLDLDYQRLYDAFFKNQTRPKLYAFGEVYYEGKEFEEFDASRYKPGVISPELKAALGVSDGMVLPWVLRMKQLGSGPPAYPDLRIPGFNAPLESGPGISGDVVEIGRDEAFGIEREPFGKLVSFEVEEEEEGEEEQENQDVIQSEEEEGEEGAVVVAEEDLVATKKPTYKASPAGSHQEGKSNEEEEKEEQVQAPLPQANSDDEDIPLSELQFPIKSTTETPIEPKKLYQILKEKFQDGGGSDANDKDGLLATGRSYELNNKRLGADKEGNDTKRQKLEQNEEEDEEGEEEEEEEEVGKFKF
jgi:splicing factor 3B subunit 2